MSSRLTSRGWLQPLHENWPTATCRLLEDAPVVVRVLIAEVLGSGPREPGACMLITASAIEGTIGGGHLEWEAIEAGRALADAVPSAPAVQIQRLVLGTQLGQCCGGVVQLWYERFTKSDLPFLQAASRHASCVLCTMEAGHVTRTLVDSDAAAHPVQFSQTQGSATLLERIDLPRPELWIFGAGHVGQALVRILGELPVRITWVDSRTELLPSDLPENTRALHTVDPMRALAEAPKGGHYLVLTHDHGVDYALCRAILRKGDFDWLGLIGSESKGARFRSRLRRDGIASDVIARLTCPIGVSGIESKVPAAIAVGVAAQLLQLFSRPVSHTRSVHEDCGERDCSSCGVSHERLS